MRTTALLRMRPSPFVSMGPTLVRRGGHGPKGPLPYPDRPWSSGNWKHEEPAPLYRWGAYGIEATVIFWTLYNMRDSYAVRFGWRYHWQDMGYAFEGEGLHGGKFGSWLARMGFVKNAGGDVV